MCEILESLLTATKYPGPFGPDAAPYPPTAFFPSSWIFAEAICTVSVIKEEREGSPLGTTLTLEATPSLVPTGQVT